MPDRDLVLDRLREAQEVLERIASPAPADVVVSAAAQVAACLREGGRILLCGTGVQVSPVVEVDHRKVGSGEIGPISRLVSERYFDAVRGKLPEYSHWLTPIE